MNHEEHNHHHPESLKGEYVKFGSLITLITLVSFGAYSLVSGDDLSTWMRLFMGFFFLTFGMFKVFGYEDFIDIFPTYDIIAKRSRVYTYLFPIIELVLASLFLLNLFADGRNLITFVLMSVSAYGIAKAVTTKKNFQCACLGNFIKLPLSTISLVETAGMAVMALVMIIL